MSDSNTYLKLLGNIKVLSDYFFHLDRSVGRFVENGQNIYSGSKEAALMLKIIPLSEPDQFQSIIVDANTKFLELIELSSDQVLNQPISNIDSIKGIKFFDWNNITRDISHGKGHAIFDFFTPQLGKWLKFTTITPEKGMLIVLISDISDTKNSLTPHYVKVQSESLKQIVE